MDEVSTDNFPVTVAVNEGITNTLPDGWDIHKVAALVRELAVNMYDEDVTLKKYVLTKEQFNLLNENKFFKQALEVATAEWNSPQSTNKRLALEAAITLETVMPSIGARLQKPDEPLPGIIEGAKLLAKMASIGEDKTGGVPTEKFSIVINMGADTLRIDTARGTEIQNNSRTENETAPLLALPKGT